MNQLYNANHKRWDHVGNLTPNVEISEGIRPSEELKPASYLKLVRFDKYLEDYYVVSAGKVVALDSNGDVVPAGLALQAAEYVRVWDLTGGTHAAQEAAARAAVDVLGTADIYGTEDTTPTASGVGVVAADGVAAVAGEYLVESILTVGGTEINALTGGDAAAVIDGANVTFSDPIGIAPYNYFRWAGGDGFNPSQYNHHNYNMQHQVAVLCDYYIELPRIDDKALIKFPGMAVMFDSGLAVKPGDFLTFDLNSDMVVWAGTERFNEVIGQVWAVDSGFPKDYLERVRTAYVGLNDLDAMPGSANAGLPDNIAYAGGTAVKGVVRINLINR